MAAKSWRNLRQASWVVKKNKIQNMPVKLSKFKTVVYSIFKYLSNDVMPVVTNNTVHVT